MLSLLLFFLEYDFSKFTRVLIDTESGHILVELEVSKTLKDLLESSLADRVIFKLVLLFELFNQFEQESN